MSFTKGEWQRVREEGKNGIDGYRWEVWSNVEWTHGTKWDNRRIALCNSFENAQLIASAPELLEACKTAKLWHQGDRYRMGNETERKQWERMRDTIQKAINKAESK